MPSYTPPPLSADNKKIFTKVETGEPQIDAKVHQNAPNRIINFKNFPGFYPWTPSTGSLPQALGKERERKGK